MRGKGDGADQDDNDGSLANFAAKEIADGGLIADGFAFGVVPFFRFGNGSTDPEDQQGGDDSDEKEVTRRGRDDRRHQPIGEYGEEDADVHAALQNRGDPGTP